MLSGVSGGSLGFATYASVLVEREANPGFGQNATWISTLLTDDYLAAPTAWALFVDIPRTLLGFGSEIPDRAEIMEEALLASWANSDARTSGLDLGLFSLWNDHPDVPLLVFSGTSVNDACRGNISVLDASSSRPDTPGCEEFGADPVMSTSDTSPFLPATHDIGDYLCAGEDVRLSTAALLSARFPLISAAGRLASENSACDGLVASPVYVVDGGYLEGSGSGTLLDIWKALEPFVSTLNRDTGSSFCVVPVMFHIDNGYEQAAAGASATRPRGSIVPMVTLLNAQTGRLRYARSEAALTFDRPFDGDGVAVFVQAGDGSDPEPLTSRYARLTTYAHPGRPGAPRMDPLGGLGRRSRIAAGLSDQRRPDT